MLQIKNLIWFFFICVLSSCLSCFITQVVAEDGLDIEIYTACTVKKIVMYNTGAHLTGLTIFASDRPDTPPAQSSFVGGAGNREPLGNETLYLEDDEYLTGVFGLAVGCPGWIMRVGFVTNKRLSGLFGGTGSYLGPEVSFNFFQNGDPITGLRVITEPTNGFIKYITARFDVGIEGEHFCHAYARSRYESLISNDQHDKAVRLAASYMLHVGAADTANRWLQSQEPSYKERLGFISKEIALFEHRNPDVAAVRLAEAREIVNLFPDNGNPDIKASLLAHFEETLRTEQRRQVQPVSIDLLRQVADML